VSQYNLSLLSSRTTHNIIINHHHQSSIIIVIMFLFVFATNSIGCLETLYYGIPPERKT